MRRPPDLCRKIVGCFADGFNRRWKEQRLRDCADLRPQSLLARLRPEGCEIRRDHVPGDDLRASILKCADLSRKVVRKRLEVRRMDHLVSMFYERRGDGIAMG